MLGIILCGGKSLRMGSDKGLLKLEAKTWAQTAIDKITSLHIPVAISVNNEQYAAYSQIFSEGDLIADNASLAIGGPLLGLLSCHMKNPGEDLFALGCDMPLMEPFILEKLYDVFKQQPGAEVYIYTNEGEPEPLCGIYTATGLAKIMTMLQKGELIRHSMKFMIDHLTVHSLPLQEEQKKYFRNFNAHAELNGL